MHTRKRLTIVYLAMAAALLVLFALNLFWGSVALSPADVVSALLGRGQDVLTSNILLQLRLPRAVMVVLLGAALSVAGYLLQTFFANPIAGPFVMGISSGAKLAVALTMVVFLNRGLLTNSLTLILAAFAGAMAAMLFVLAVARCVQRMRRMCRPGHAAAGLSAGMPQIAGQPVFGAGRCHGTQRVHRHCEG